MPDGCRQGSIGKDIIDVQEAYENLANAIVKSAVDVYWKALVYADSHPESESARRKADEAEAFFYSDWYDSLTKLDGAYLVKRLKKKLEVENAHRLEFS